MKHLLKMIDLTTEEIAQLLKLAIQLKQEQKAGVPHKHLEGKTIGLIFEKASTRTRVSFEVGATQLGAYPLFLSSSDLQIGRGEPIQDTARVLSRYLDGIMIRTFEQQVVEDMARFGNIPIINGLTDDSHPCQVLADLLTINEYKGDLNGVKFCYIGDGNNMANSLIIGCLKMGMNVSVATPKGYEPHALALEFAQEHGDRFLLTNNPKEAARHADVVCTDVWASMGQESEQAERKAIFEGFQINSDLMTVANSEAMVLHCLPAHRGEEITEEIFEKHAKQIFDEAENRLHAQKAVMLTLMK